MMTQTRPTELHQRRILMTRRPAAAAEARRQVRAIIRGWEVPVDPDIAVLLTSDLVTHAIVHWDSETITLAVRCSRDQLRVDVYDTSLPLPMAVDEQAVRQAPARTGARRLPVGRMGLVPDLHRQGHVFRARVPGWLVAPIGKDTIK